MIHAILLPYYYIITIKHIFQVYSAHHTPLPVRSLIQKTDKLTLARIPRSLPFSFWPSFVLVLVVGRISFFV